MRALRYHRRGSLEGLRLEDTQEPAPAPGEVLVRVRWASVNPVDWKLVLGKFRFLVKGGLPRGTGSDFAGEVAALGPGVAGLVVGQRVYGCVDPFRSTFGTMADFVPAPAGSVFALPQQLPLREAAALACAGLSAAQVCDQGQVVAGSRVLVNGASGGVGHVALQLARARGAHVTAVASAGRRDFIESLGTDAFIDYRSTAPDSWPGGFDAVLDCVPSIPRSRHADLAQARRPIRHDAPWRGHVSSRPDHEPARPDPSLGADAGANGGGRRGTEQCVSCGPTACRDRGRVSAGPGAGRIRAFDDRSRARQAGGARRLRHRPGLCAYSSPASTATLTSSSPIRLNSAM